MGYLIFTVLVVGLNRVLYGTEVAIVTAIVVLTGIALGL